MAKADLHIHTTMSDGTNTIYEILDMCKARDIDTIAITDHDTVSAFDDFNNTSDIKVIPGIEFSTTYQNKSVHILGYFIDHTNEPLRTTLNLLIERRIKRAKKIINKLKEVKNISIDYNNIKRNNNTASIGRMHIAKEMERLGYIQDVQEAFIKYIGDNGPCFVENEKLTIKQAVNLIKGAGGISFLAHPGLIKDITDYEEILSFGLDGIEVFHPKHSYEQRKYFFNLAIKHGLLISGGSDFHSRKTKGKNKLASAYLSSEYLKQIIDFHKNMTK